MISEKKQREMLSQLTKQIDRISGLTPNEMACELKELVPSYNLDELRDWHYAKLATALCKEHAYRVFDPEASKLVKRKAPAAVTSDPHQCERCGENLTPAEEGRGTHMRFLCDSCLGILNRRAVTSREDQVTKHKPTKHACYKKPYENT